MSAETVERFPEGADAERKQKFAKDLIEALDRVGVKPGENFSVMTEDALDKQREEFEDKLQRADERVMEAEAEAEEARSLRELIEDMSRGVRTVDELYNAAGVTTFA